MNNNGRKRGCPVAIRAELNKEMRTLWEQHVMWTRMLVISIVDGLKDTAAVTKRLLQNPADIGRLFAKCFGEEAGKKVAELLTAHLTIGARLITATKMHNYAAADKLNTLWYQNADSIAAALAGLSKKYDEQRLRNMLHEHLELTKLEVALRMNANYAADTANFDKIERQALEMADYFVEGMIAAN